ncbi:MAG: type II toxin-antitoxin system PemK/MazF family toxin [Bacilli bacterium]|nr:type II toxin-antitoxin system PemK/MazF family toxin [Bacilli bacterium]
MNNGQIFYINFSGYKGSEINDTHLGIVFRLPNVKNMVFCIPLTSPKRKHFKSIEAFNNRNYNELKYQNLIYINQTDSIALLDQLRTISTARLLNEYKDADNHSIVLNEENLSLITIKTIKYLKHIFKY